MIHRIKTGHENDFKRPKAPITYKIHNLELLTFCFDCETATCIKCITDGGNHFCHKNKPINESKNEIENAFQKIIKEYNTDKFQVNKNLECLQKEYEMLEKYMKEILKMEEEISMIKKLN